MHIYKSQIFDYFYYKSQILNIDKFNSFELKKLKIFVFENFGLWVRSKFILFGRAQPNPFFNWPLINEIVIS